MKWHWMNFQMQVTFMDPFMDSVQLPQGYRATGGVVYFLP